MMIMTANLHRFKYRKCEMCVLQRRIECFIRVIVSLLGFFYSYCASFSSFYLPHAAGVPMSNWNPHVYGGLVTVSALRAEAQWNYRRGRRNEQQKEGIRITLVIFDSSFESLSSMAVRLVINID